MTQPSLFEDEPAKDPRKHMLMPNMGIACGADVLTRGVHFTTRTTETTCAECVTAGTPHGGLSRWCWVMQGRADLYDATHPRKAA